MGGCPHLGGQGCVAGGRASRRLRRQTVSPPPPPACPSAACRLALEWGILNCHGKTPEATMASSLYGDVKRKDKVSMFIR